MKEKEEKGRGDQESDIEIVERKFSTLGTKPENFDEGGSRLDRLQYTNGT